jgi:hypothetical protein
MVPYASEPPQEDRPSMLATALGAVGNVLSAPRRALWGALGMPEHGKDIFSYMGEGFVPSALGFGAEVLLDPLTYVGGGLARTIAKGLTPTKTLGKAAAAGNGLAVNPALKGAAEGGPVFSGLTVQQMPKNMIGGGEVMPGVMQGGEWLPSLNSVYSSSGDEGISLAGSFVGGRKAGFAHADAMDAARRSVSSDEALDALGGFTVPGQRGVFMPRQRFPAEVAGSDKAQAWLATRRHERYHDLVEAARSNPEVRAQLPFLGRAAASLEQSPRQFLRGVGNIANELGAVGAESRTLLGGLRNQAGLLFNPKDNAAYLGQFTARSPLAASLYSKLPSAFVGAGGLAGHGVGEGLASFMR